MKNSLFSPAISRRKLNFNPEGFDLAKVLKARNTKRSLVTPQKTERSDSHLNAFADFQPVELVDHTSGDERALVINAAYKQIFGNAHLMESEKLLEVESQLCSGEITVMEFVRQLAKSDRYRTLFFDRCTNVRAIELNFKHLLGRAPEDYEEISQHIKILAEGGFEAEIDSYLDSDEYFQNFGTNIVPYYRGYQTQTGKNLAGFTHSFQLLRGASSSDKSTSISSAPQLQEALIENKSSEINPLSSVAATEPVLSPLEPVKVEYNPFKDLEIKNIGYEAPKSAETSVSPRTWLQEYRAKEAAATFPAARSSQPVKLSDDISEEQIEIIISAAYKQVFGNSHVMESERLVASETKLKKRQITVKGFISELANSDLYRSLFFDNCSNIRAIELNFKHLLGRAPDSSQEISEHIKILVEGGFAAEIASYLNSEEYNQNFGNNTVPYYVSYSTQTGKNVAGYNRIFQLMNGSSSSDRSIGSSIASSQKSQLQQSILKKPLIKKPIVFNPQGFNLAKTSSVGAGQPFKPSSFAGLYKSTSASYINAFADSELIEFVPGDSVGQQDLVIEAAYKQVFGNAHLMESERLTQVESQLRNGQITVMEFIRQLAKSGRYRALFFEGCTNLRAIELNFKHLLGRAPENSAEISQHIKILAEQGFEAEIDSYLDSDEYVQSFGTNIVPYYRGYKTQTGKELSGFTRSFQLLNVASSSDKSIAKSTYTELDQNLLANRSNQISACSTVSDIDIQTVYSSNTVPNVFKPKPSKQLDPSEYPVYKAASQNSDNNSQPVTDTVDLIQKVLNIS